MSEDDDPCQNSPQQIKIVIRKTGFKIYAEGTISSLNKELEAIICFSDKVADSLGIEEESDVDETQVTSDEVEKISAVDIPSIKSSKSTIQNLESLFSTPWGKTPRTLAEIVKALEVNAIPDKVASVNVYLRRLVKRGILRRLEKEGKYHYFKLPE